MSKPVVRKVQVRELSYQLDRPEFAGIKGQLQALLPKPYQTISFELTGASSAIANALRRTVIEELPVRCLEVDTDDISTNEEYIQRKILAMRISQIPISQDLAVGTKFSISVTAKATGLTPVLGSDIVDANGKPGPWSGSARIDMLRASRYLRINNITVTEGCGYRNTRYKLTDAFEYCELDYYRVNFLNHSGCIQNRAVRVDELLALAKRLGVKIDASTLRLGGPAILVIPSRSYQLVRPDFLAAQIKLHAHVLENNVDADDPDKFLWAYSSTVSNPTEYYLSFTLFGQADPLEVLRRTCTNLAERAELVTAELLKEHSNMINITRAGDLYQVQIEGEDHTLGHLIRRTVLELEPGVGLVNLQIIHPDRRACIVNVKHPAAEKLFRSALEWVSKMFRHMAEEFVAKK